ncbi:hypothetical protein CH06BL_16420 [Chromobacterium haemolyticum]|nr:hypothetical protein CH06BL_16420 [Chromobacterium haemolyticum]
MRQGRDPTRHVGGVAAIGAGATPLRLWTGSWGVRKGASLGESSAVGGHPFALNKPIHRPNADNPGHGEGASNPVYRELWQEMLGRLWRGE